MHLSMPEEFCVKVEYIDFNILDIDKISDEVKKRNTIVIGVILPNREKTRWSKAGVAMESEARNTGSILKVEYNNFNIENQISLIEKFIIEKIDVLVIVPLNQARESEALEKAKKAGIKIIAQDIIAKQCPIDLYVGFNMLKVGALQGKFLIDKVPKGNYIILSGSPNGELVRRGAMQFINPLVYSGKINIIADEIVKEWDPKHAFEIVEKALIKSENQVDAILASNDAIAGTVIKALQVKELAGRVVVTGQDGDYDAVKRIIEGIQAMTVFNNSIELGKKTINYAINLINNKNIDYNYLIDNGKIEVAAVLIEPIVLDKTNIYGVIGKTEYYKEYFI